VRHLLVFAFTVLLFSSASAHDNVNVGINIGFNVDSYPRLVRMPGYPVYYDPHVPSNYFFYDGLYWVFQNDNWYQSGWYNGPWNAVAPEYVPMYVLRVPVRYYRHPPKYFHGWRADAPPHWDEHWGNDWQQHRAGWNQWDHKSAPPPAPLPVYQKQYLKDRYPTAPEQQQSIRSEKYQYEPHDADTKQHWQQQPVKHSDSHDDHDGGHGNPHSDPEQHGNGPDATHNDHADKHDREQDQDQH
jgi:hypothetical protein